MGKSLNVVVNWNIFGDTFLECEIILHLESREALLDFISEFGTKHCDPVSPLLLGLVHNVGKLEIECRDRAGTLFQVVQFSFGCCFGVRVIKCTFQNLYKVSSTGEGVGYIILSNRYAYSTCQSLPHALPYLSNLYNIVVHYP